MLNDATLTARVSKNVSNIRFGRNLIGLKYLTNHKKQFIKKNICSIFFLIKKFFFLNLFNSIQIHCMWRLLSFEQDILLSSLSFH